MATSGNLTGQNTGVQLTLLQGASLASHTALPGSEEAGRITETSGRRWSELSKRYGHLGFLLRILLESSVWGSLHSLPTWKVSGTNRSYFVFHLIPAVYKRWNGTSGLLPRPTKSDSKGSVKARYRGSQKCKNNFREVIRECEIDGIYPKPDFVEWVKGFPEGWTDLQCKNSDLKH